MSVVVVVVFLSVLLYLVLCCFLWAGLSGGEICLFGVVSFMGRPL